jgi:hypothetical protein
MKILRPIETSGCSSDSHLRENRTTTYRFFYPCEYTDYAVCTCTVVLLNVFYAVILVLNFSSFQICKLLLTCIIRVLFMSSNMSYNSYIIALLPLFLESFLICCKRVVKVFSIPLWRQTIPHPQSLVKQCGGGSIMENKEEGASIVKDVQAAWQLGSNSSRVLFVTDPKYP